MKRTGTPRAASLCWCWPGRAPRWAPWLCAAWALAAAVGIDSRPARAQPAADSAAPAADSAAPAADGDAPADTSPPKSSGKQKTLLGTINDGGIIGYIIIFLSLISVAFMIEHLLTINRSRVMPEYHLLELEQFIANGEIQQAVEFCQNAPNPSLASECVLAGLERYQSSEFGFAEYKTAVEEAGEDHTARLYRKTEVLGVIGSIAPMLGLLGTVTGMISSFNVIQQTGGKARPEDLAGGISEALVTTVLGLIVAIPVMVAFSYFRNKIDHLVAEAGKRVERVMAPLGRRR